jgi:hypothetical protein
MSTLQFIPGGITNAMATRKVGEVVNVFFEECKLMVENIGAKELHDTIAKLESERRKAGFALGALGEAKVKILSESATHFIDLFDKIHNVDDRRKWAIGGMVGLQFGVGLKIDAQLLDEMKKLRNIATSIIENSDDWTSDKALIPFGAYGATMVLEEEVSEEEDIFTDIEMVAEKYTAFTFSRLDSSESAVASLHDVANYNSTMMFLDESYSMELLGLRLFGVLPVLGDAITEPTCKIVGDIFAAEKQKMARNLLSEWENLKSAKDKRELPPCEILEVNYDDHDAMRRVKDELETAIAICKSIVARTETLFDMLVELDKRFVTAIDKAKAVTDVSDFDFSKYTDSSKEIVHETMAAAAAIKSVLNTPILTAYGELANGFLGMTILIKNHFDADSEGT